MVCVLVWEGSRTRSVRILKRGVAAFGHDDIRDGHAATRLKDARHLREGLRRVGHVMKRVAAGNNAGGLVGERHHIA